VGSAVASFPRRSFVPDLDFFTFPTSYWSGLAVLANSAGSYAGVHLQGVHIPPFWALGQAGAEIRNVSRETLR
jgi:hypothetical protein